ncbi:tetratricopeptide repeat protein [Phormidesmis sp. 146-12]
METVNLLAVLGVVAIVAGFGIGSMVWAYVGSGSRQVLFSEPIAIDLSPETEASKAFQQGCLNYQSGRYQAAIDSFSQAIQFNPTFAEAFHNRGLTWANLRRDDDATINLVKASELYLERGDRASVIVIKQNLEALKARKLAREKAKQKG